MNAPLVNVQFVIWRILYRGFSVQHLQIHFHLSLVRTVSVSWDRASLYLELASGSIDCNALTQWVRAKARVLSRPSLLRTASKAACTSPGLENLLAIMASSSGNFALANKTGAVARPSSRSAAAGLPSCSELKKKRKSYKFFIQSWVVCYIYISYTPASTWFLFLVFMHPY